MTEDTTGLHRSSYAIRKNLQSGLEQAITLMGLASVGELLTVVATDPEFAAEGLGKAVALHRERKLTLQKAKQDHAELRERIKTADPETAAQIKALLDKQHG